MDAMEVLKRKKSETVKGDGIGFDLINSIERPKVNFVPLFGRTIYKVFDENCIHCRKDKDSDLFAICTDRHRY